LVGLSLVVSFLDLSVDYPSISPVRDVMVYPLPEDSHVLRDYWVCEPYARVVVAEDVSGEG
jgi:hypothetical protein